MVKWIKKMKGFTLLELLVVTAIIAMLSSILLPVLSKAREKGRSSVCISNLKQLALGFQMYANDNDGYFPYSFYMLFTGEIGWDFQTTDWVTWTPGSLSPYLNEKIYECPSFRLSGAVSTDRPYTGYAFNTTYLGGQISEWDGTNIPPKKITNVNVPAETVLVSDAAMWSTWTNNIIGTNYLRAPSDLVWGSHPQTSHFRHNETCNVAFVDGHVDVLKQGYNPNTSAPLCADLSSDDSLYDLD